MRISEIYLSVQGEGPRVGQQTVFVRFAGCNLRCPGWPCDTPHAIFPEKFRQEWEVMTPMEIAMRVMSIAPEPWVNVCFTGGEPFLQNNEQLEALTSHLKEQGRTVECFSNGTFVYPEWALDDICFVMDWKLAGSGEDTWNSNRIENVEYLLDSGNADAIKFTIKDRDDYDRAVSIWEEYIKPYGTVDVYYGIVWGEITNEELVGWVLEDRLPWLLNVQVHNHIWDRSKRGI